MRILVTGSRKWFDYPALENALLDNTRAAFNRRAPIIIVVGDCPTGVDNVASRLARYHGWTIDLHIAHWRTQGSAAGPIRNQEMVDAGADVCLAFPLGVSRGTRDCMRRAAKAGIPVINYGDKDS